MFHVSRFDPNAKLRKKNIVGDVGCSGAKGGNGTKFVTTAKGKLGVEAATAANDGGGVVKLKQNKKKKQSDQIPQSTSTKALNKGNKKSKQRSHDDNGAGNEKQVKSGVIATEQKKMNTEEKEKGDTHSNDDAPNTSFSTLVSRSEGRDPHASDHQSESSTVSSFSSDEDDQSQPKTTLKVIAPFQSVHKSPSLRNNKRKFGGIEDEAVDDFDIDRIIDGVSHDSKSSNNTARANQSTQNAINDPGASAGLGALQALHLSRLPISEAASSKHFNLPSFLIQNLQNDSYTNFFPIQCMVIPGVIESERNAQLRGARDVCCHAPTGSGKTLAFVLPLLTVLYDEGSGGARGPRRLRALVVLPNRDLAKQVYDVIVQYAEGSHLKIGLAVGGGGKGGGKKIDLMHERMGLVVESWNESFGEVGWKSETDKKVKSKGYDKRMQDEVQLKEKEESFVTRRKLNGVTDSVEARFRHYFDPTSIQNALEAFDGTLRKPHGKEALNGIGSISNGFDGISGQSAIDILVSTPGRLVDHLDSTPGFTLRHLRFLVIDEADRLVNQPYQNWIHRVLEAVNSENLWSSSFINRYHVPMSLAEYVKSPLERAPDGISFVIDPVTHRFTGSTHNAHRSADGEEGLIGGTHGLPVRPVPLRKMLFSATLTQDPAKLARLGLNNPKHFNDNRLRHMEKLEQKKKRTAEMKQIDHNEDKQHVTHSTEVDGNTHTENERFQAGRYTLPESLTERMVECKADQKPLVLLALLLEEEQRNHISKQSTQSDSIKTDNPKSVGEVPLSIVFTSSVDSTHRLARLLQLLWKAGGFGNSSAIAEYSSSVSSKQRAAILRRCRERIGSKNWKQGRLKGKSDGRVSVLVCSDGMSRGMDLPSVSSVINYDVPAFAKTYVHRCGRTSRAGREGKVISVLKGGQVGAFRKMRRLVVGGQVQEVGIRKELVRRVIPTYKSCVVALKNVLEAEGKGELLPTDHLDGTIWIPK